MPYIPPPEYTQMPNAILDAMGAMGNAELRVVLAICRKTFGWRKREDRISLSQLEDLTGLSRQGVIDGVEVAIRNEWITREQSGQGWVYSVNVVDQTQEGASQASRLELVNPVDQQGAKVVKPVDTQKKDLKKDKETTLQPPAAPAPSPEKPEGEKPKAKREPKPKTPERQAKDAEIDAVLAVFVEVTGIPKPSKQNANYGVRWVNVARDFIARHNGRSADAMRLAAEKHKRGRDGAGQPLSTKDPGSVKYACPTKEELDAYLAKRNAAQAPRRAPAQFVFEK